MSNEEQSHLPVPNPQSAGALADRPPSSMAFPQSGEYRGHHDEDEINLLDLWQILVRRKWTVIVFFLIVTTTGITASFLMTPIYRAGVTLLIDREPPKVVDYQEKEVGVAGGVGLNNISVVDPAKIPLEFHTPNIPLNTLVAMLLGLFGGIGLAFLFEHLDDTLKQSEDMERVLGLSVLGLIPAISRPDKSLSGEGELALISIEDKRSAFAEAYRSVRTALQFSTPEGAPKSLLVVSANKGEGKSTTAASLAIHFAQAGQKVLLVDGDLRSPSLHRILETPNDTGLTHYLAGEATPVDISQPTTIPNLFLITTGPLPPDPAGLLGSAKMMSLLSTAKEKFDHVIVDSPPVLGLADALILGNLVDGTLFVVAAGHTRRAFAQGAIKRLKMGHTRLLGGILNKFDSRSHGYGYHDYYYYQGDSPSLLSSDQKVA
ncbi:CpsD/CapB family tyrosine-protein kinase [Nitrosococcus oceani]|uniref:CpsD/CapB family tyrosine-protein kinase n=1 Tax=Nitrosococcus oceani TaxID=1229 RepID=UPI0004E900D2|nr:CpsD/CapB family tyrosine-protein kinase [Nitrosococcus oceani]KFI22571.1 hypothetical protein HW44_09070 [Nitrosococcus oceani]